MYLEWMNKGMEHDMSFLLTGLKELAVITEFIDKHAII